MLAAIPFPRCVVLKTKKTMKESLDCSKINLEALQCCVSEARYTAVTIFSTTSSNSAENDQLSEYLKTAKMDPGRIWKSVGRDEKYNFYQSWIPHKKPMCRKLRADKDKFCICTLERFVE